MTLKNKKIQRHTMKSNNSVTLNGIEGVTEKYFFKNLLRKIDWSYIQFIMLTFTQTIADFSIAMTGVAD